MCWFSPPSTKVASKMSKKNRREQNAVNPGDFSSPTIRSMVGKSPPAFKRTTKVVTKKHHQQTIPTMGQNKMSSIKAHTTSLFRVFVCKMLCKSGVPRSVAKHTAKFAWREGTVRNMGTCTKRWLLFAKKAKIGKFDFSFENIISFLEYLFVELKVPFSRLDRCSSFTMVARKLVGCPLNTSEAAKVKKYLAACFNANPPPCLKRGQKPGMSIFCLITLVVWGTTVI